MKVSKIAILFYLIISQLAVGAQELIDAVLQEEIEASEVNDLLSLLGDSTQVSFDVRTYKVRYYTPHLDGLPDTASGFMALPVVTADMTLPILIYQHGTADSRENVPSRGSTESILAIAAAGLGYVALAPDYLGLGDSKGLHPYLHAATEASSAFDLFNAANSYLTGQSIDLNGQIFISGYSQGGHAAMALHNYMEINALPDNFSVVAVSPMSGPYSVSGEMVRRLTSDIPYAFPGYAIYTLLSYDQVYNLFEDLSQILKTPYIEVVEQFLQEQFGVSELHVRLSDILLQETGSMVIKEMFLDSIISGLSDPDNAILLALQANDTYNWAPEAPTRLVYCKGDDQVVYTNSIFADSVMNTLGATDLISVDIVSDADHTSCVIPAVRYTLDFFEQFRLSTSDRAIVLDGVRIFPNPTHSHLTLEGLPSIGLVNVYNEFGQMVFNQQIGNTREHIDLTPLNTGVYFLKISTIRGSKSWRLMVF